MGVSPQLASQPVPKKEHGGYAVNVVTSGRQSFTAEHEVAVALLVPAKSSNSHSSLNIGSPSWPLSKGWGAY